GGCATRAISRPAAGDTRRRRAGAPIRRDAKTLARTRRRSWRRRSSESLSHDPARTLTGDRRSRIGRPADPLREGRSIRQGRATWGRTYPGRAQEWSCGRTDHVLGLPHHVSGHARPGRAVVVTGVSERAGTGQGDAFAAYFCG